MTRQLLLTPDSWPEFTIIRDKGKLKIQYEDDDNIFTFDINQNEELELIRFLLEK